MVITIPRVSCARKRNRKKNIYFRYFLELYFASGTVLKPSDEPYDLRSKIHQANRELANDNHSAYDNAPGKVKFDDTVVVLDSFEDIGKY